MEIKKVLKIAGMRKILCLGIAAMMLFGVFSFLAEGLEEESAREKQSNESEVGYEIELNEVESQIFSMEEDEPEKQEIKVKVHMIEGSGISEEDVEDWIEDAESEDVFGCSFNFSVEVNYEDEYNESKNHDNKLNIWAAPQNPWSEDFDSVNPDISAQWRNEVMLVPGDGDNISIKSSTLAHEMGHYFGLGHENDDPENIMCPDNWGDPPKSCNRKGTNVTESQQENATESPNAQAQKAFTEDRCANIREPNETAEEMPEFIDLNYAQVWTNDTHLHLTSTVKRYEYEDCRLGFYLETDGDTNTGDPDEGLDYYVGFNPMMEETIFEEWADEEWRQLGPTEISFDFAYIYPDININPTATGVEFTLPLYILERIEGDTLSFRATGEFDTYVDNLPEDGLKTINYAADSYYLEVSSTDGGEVTEPGEGTFEYAPDDVVDLAAEADPDYHFVGWTGDNDTIADPEDSATTITMEDDYTITAVFEINKYDLTINSTEGGEVTDPGEGSFEYQAGTSVNIVASAAEGYKFVEWTGDVEDMDDPEIANSTITIDEDKVLTANFEIDDDTEEDEDDIEEDDGIPGFTLTILLLAMIISGVIYQKKTYSR
ncbi:MAG: hypothetical protein KGY68_08920 [Candidatus Thermoplasmatota archaeon]|nr:hypothetical protein [Candidatus Thermoplasmatota archaeon]